MAQDEALLLSSRVLGVARLRRVRPRLDRWLVLDAFLASAQSALPIRDRVAASLTRRSQHAGNPITGWLVREVTAGLIAPRRGGRSSCHKFLGCQFSRSVSQYPWACKVVRRVAR
jgi:hypothetical protein